MLDIGTWSLRASSVGQGPLKKIPAAVCSTILDTQIAPDSEQLWMHAAVRARLDDHAWPQVVLDLPDMVGISGWPVTSRERERESESDSIMPQS